MPFSPTKIRVGVLRGGPSPEYEVSLKTGGTVLANLPEEYEPIDIFISKDGAWHMAGLERDPHKIIKTIDVAFNALHGEFGEDGTVQNLLEQLGIPYTGSKSLSSALGMNKIMAKDVFKRSGLKTPHHFVIEKDENENRLIKKINENITFPIIIKPINSGSSLGVSFVDKIGNVKKALENSFKHSRPNDSVGRASKVMVEEFIKGKEATCGVIEGFRGEYIYTLLPVEIIQNKKEIFYDYDSKYKNLESRHQVPGNFKESEKIQIEEAASLIHEALGLRHYSRSDFIIHPKRGLFVLEVNTLPELSHRSSFVKSLEAVGSNIQEFLSHLITQTLRK